MTTPVARLSAALADRYRIERELGQGGMATVYLAADRKHDRKVALKVLRPELAAVLGADRFVQEIKTTAALQHPHILPLFDSGTADGFLYYVMPFIDGETLRAKLDRETQLGVEEAVKLAVDVAEALDYAHQQGVIHRDIKPENILLAKGRPLVADFGIALAVSAAAGGRMTETGLSLGTPHYMSPEQATAEKELTARSDVYSLASVLYEMLTGQPPHVGASAQQIIMKIVTEEPAPVAAHRKAVPPHVAAATTKALEKLPADRFASAAEFAAALLNPAFRHRDLTGAAVAPGRSRLGWSRALAGLVLTALAVGLIVGWALTRTEASARDLGLPPNAPMQMSAWYRSFAVAADGTFLVYEARTGETTSLWYRSLDGNVVRPIPGTDRAYGTPRLSTDGKRVAFAAMREGQRELRVANLDGSGLATVASGGAPLGGGWLADGPIFYGDDDGRVLKWINPEGGVSREVAVEYCILPQLVGTGDQVLCGGGADKYATVRFLDHPMEKRPLRASAGSPAALLIGSDFRLIDGRYLVYLAIDGTLMAARITDLDSLTVGRSVALVPMVRRNAYTGAGQYDLTADGTLVYAPGINAELTRPVRVGRDRRVTAMNVGEAAHLRFAPSPDGQRLATVVEGIEQQELRVYDLSDGSYETHDRGLFLGSPAWSPNGTRLAYRKTDRPGHEALLLRRLDSPDSPQVLLSEPIGTQPSSYLAEDALLVGVGTASASAMLIDPTLTPPRIDTLGVSSFFLSISPDRRWIAVQHTGITGVELQPWPARDRRFLVDADAFEPRWRSATELAFQLADRGVHQVTVAPSGGSPVGKPEPIVEATRFADTPGWSLAVAPNGDLIYLESPAENLGYYLRVIPDWVKQMKRAVDAASR